MPASQFSTKKFQVRERGSVLVVALVTLSTLLMAGALTVLKVRRGGQASAESRFQSVALFAAESGVSSAMDYLRSNVAPVTFFGAMVSPSNSAVVTPLAIPGNTLAPTDPNNLFTGALEMSFAVSVWNNPSDPGFALGTDTDGIVSLRSIGRGPGNSMVVVEVEVDGRTPGPLEVLDWRTIR